MNSDHLELGTHLDNSRDAVEAGRLPSGPGSRPRKLTSEDAVAILGAWMLGIPLKETAEMWDVAIITAAHIRMGRSWVRAIAKHVNEALGTPETPIAAP